MSYKVGDTLSTYTLLCECGQGAYGSVFLAENTFTKRRVALKIVYSQGRSCERELNGLIQYQTVCPRTNLLQIYHVEKGDDCFWYTMDAADNLSAEEGKYIPDTLANRLREQRRLPTDAVRKMADELIANLETLHRRGLLHRDLKPDNILWVDGSAILGDIGLVTDTTNVSLAGTPGFLPPEVLAGIREYHQADDYYSLGKVIYCALTGMPVEKYPAYPASLTLCGGADMIRLYNNLCSGAVPETAFQPQPPRRKTKWLIAAALIQLLLTAALFAGVFFLRKSVPQQIPEQPVQQKIQQQPVQQKVQQQKVPEQPVQQKVPEQPVQQAKKKRTPRFKTKEEYKKQFALLNTTYQHSEEFQKLLPTLREKYNELMALQMDNMGKALQSSVSPAEIAEAQAYILQHPEDVYSILPPEQYVQSKRRDAAAKAFEREYANDPVWLYFELRNELIRTIGSTVPMFNIKYIHRDPAWDDAYDKVKGLYQKLLALEPVLIKKYQK